MSIDKSQAMRAMLAQNGIFLDEPKPSRPPASATPSPPTIDRDAIRAILVAAGAPARDIEWLVASCPSVAHARTYTPPTAPETETP